MKLNSKQVSNVSGQHCRAPPLPNPTASLKPCPVPPGPSFPATFPPCCTKQDTTELPPNTNELLIHLLQLPPPSTGKSQVELKAVSGLTFEGIQREHLHPRGKGGFLGQQEGAQRNSKLELILPLKCFRCFCFVSVVTMRFVFFKKSFLGQD